MSAYNYVLTHIQVFCIPLGGSHCYNTQGQNRIAASVHTFRIQQIGHFMQILRVGDKKLTSGSRSVGCCFQSKEGGRQNGANATRKNSTHTRRSSLVAVACKRTRQSRLHPRTSDSTCDAVHSHRMSHLRAEHVCRPSVTPPRSASTTRGSCSSQHRHVTPRCSGSACGTPPATPTPSPPWWH